jgi:serine/threonine protein phosphatase PrpC
MLSFAAKTDVGTREGENEDSIGWDEQKRIWLVADGMGGHVSGRTASEIARKSMLDAAAEQSTEEQVVAAHEAIIAAADEDGALSGMGSTIVVAKVADNSAEISWVGDSRAYLWRRGVLKQVSRDHSFIELLRAQNMLTEEQIRADPRGNLVTQTLGHGEPSPSIIDVPLRYGDWILLCSDGLNGELQDIEIASILASSKTIQNAVDMLVDAAITHGGRDNTSVIIIESKNANGIGVLWQLLDPRWLPLVIGALMAILIALLLWAGL